MQAIAEPSQVVQRQSIASATPSRQIASFSTPAHYNCSAIQSSRHCKLFSGSTRSSWQISSAQIGSFSRLSAWVRFFAKYLHKFVVGVSANRHLVRLVSHLHLWIALASRTALSARGYLLGGAGETCVTGSRSIRDRSGLVYRSAVGTRSVTFHVRFATSKLGGCKVLASRTMSSRV